MSRLKEDVALAGEPRGTIGDSAAIHDADVKLGALGMADPLGAALWRAKYKGDPRARRQAEALIARRIAQGGRWGLAAAPRPKGLRGRRTSEELEDMPRPLIERLAFRVLGEWLNDRCTACHGRGTVGAWGAVMRCKRCSGSQREPAQHATRARDLGVTREVYHQRWQPVFERMLTRLEEIDHGVTGVLRGQLRTDTVRINAENDDCVDAL